MTEGRKERGNKRKVGRDKERERENHDYFPPNFSFFYNFKMYNSQKYYVPWADQYSLSIKPQDIAFGHRN